MIYSVEFNGPAGLGVKSAGLILARLAVKSGYFAFCYYAYPSLIRGGHNSVQVTISSEPVMSPRQKNDLVLEINSDLPDNTAMLGAAAAVLGGDLGTLKDLVTREYSAEAVASAEVGYKHGREKLADKAQAILKPLPNPASQVLINGNDAAAFGAIAGGLQFAAVYPMSPISGILHQLAAHQEEYGYIYKQPEDEISAVTMAVGAAFAGARAMTATSGGGFCLMTEGLGLAAMTETPLVIIDGMRPGPATGLPTWSEQGDLNFVLGAHQGDSPRIVLAPSDARETFELTRQAFNLADRYQLPVIILIDKNICDSDQSYVDFEPGNFELDRGKFTTVFSPNFKRYELTDDGVSSRSAPGNGNFFVANSDEHDETGFSTEEAEAREKMMDKRMRKLATTGLHEVTKPKLYGPEEADLTIVSWGSNRGAILTALKDFPNVNYLHLTWFSPFPAQAVKQQLAKAKKLLGVECNYSGQMCRVIAQNTGIEINEKLLKYNGRPLFAEELAQKVKAML